MPQHNIGSVCFLLKSLLKFLGNCFHKRFRYEKHQSLGHDCVAEDRLSGAKTTIVFDVEGVLLKSSSVFPYFMLVALEAGGILRAVVLFLCYPILCLLSKELGLKVMVFICFFGIKEEGFKIGRTVLPKFFLEDVGYEGFEVVRSCGRRVGISEFPSIMVEGFLKDYLGVAVVLGRELKVVCGYFVGVMEAKEPGSDSLNRVFGEEMGKGSDVFVFCGVDKLPDHKLLSHCKEIYMVNEEEKRDWKILPREEYPKPLVFHDGRIAFKPTFMATLAMLVWVPFGLPLCILRICIASFLPYRISIPLLSFTGMGGRGYKYYSSINDTDKAAKGGNGGGTVYVCNHRTLLDPVYISMGLMRPVTAVTYSLSRFSSMLSPIKTAHLTRNKEKDSKMMEELLSQGDLVVCAEGTTCREPYVLRFSPLFAELSDDIVPVAIDVKMSMFYGTTASGFKFLDPIFFLLNPRGIYNVKFLKKLPRSYKCRSSGISRIEVAKRVQKEIADVLGFKCTNLTRRDKYMILAGNEGTI